MTLVFYVLVGLGVVLDNGTPSPWALAAHSPQAANGMGFPLYHDEATCERDRQNITTAHPAWKEATENHAIELQCVKVEREVTAKEIKSKVIGESI